MTADRVARLDERIAQLRARRDKMLAQNRTNERKRDTRRKIVLAGALIARARRGDEIATRAIQQAAADIADRDRSLFADWDLIAASTRAFSAKRDSLEDSADAQPL